MNGALPRAGAPLRIAVLLVAHNRRDKTVRALRSIDPTQRVETVPVLFDDASSDGTAAAAMEVRPDTIVVSGEGDAFWNGGLHRAWKTALELDVDAFLWLNDDVELDNETLDLLETAWSVQRAAGRSQFILVGATRGDDEQQTYGALRCERRLQSISFPMESHGAAERDVDTFNGNIVLVPRSVTDRIGINDPEFFHNLGDVDYGLRANAAGIPVIALPGTLGVCEGNVAKSARGYGSPALSVREQWRKVNTHHGLPPRSWLRFTRRHSGALWPIHFALPYRHLFKFWRL
jgi:GT2 family glycosyltransferase